MQDARNFQFSSDYPMAYFIYHSTHEITVPAMSGGVVSTATITVPHNLPFTPLLVGYWSDNANFTNTNDLNTQMLGGDYKSLDAGADDTNIYITGANGKTSSIKLYVKLWAYMPPDANGDVQPVFDDSNYLFNSDNTVLEIAQAGVIKLNDNPKTVYHNLGYVPYCRIWAKRYLNGRLVITPQWQTNYRGSAYGGVVDDEKLVLGVAAGDEYYHIYTAEV